MPIETRQPGMTIGRVMVHTRGAADSAAITLRLRLERLFGGVDLRPAGLPSGAVLIVRTLRGAAPNPRAPATTHMWSQRVCAELTELLRVAARPASGPVPSDAPCVLFADPCELLASLTRDLLGGRAWQLWYWRQALRGAPRAPGAALAAAWEAQAAFLPAALGLASPDEARSAVALLSPPEVSRVVRALHDHFAVSPAVFAVPRPDVPAAFACRAAPAEPPWRLWLPLSGSGGLSPQGQYLLGLATALRHAPAHARGPAFALQAADWLRSALAGAATERRSAPTAQPTERRAVDVTPVAAQLAEAAPPAQPAKPHDRASARAEAVRRVAPVPAAAAAGTRHERPRHTTQPAIAETATGSGAHALAQDARALLDQRPLNPGAHGTSALVAPALNDAGGTPTALGGVLYLINLLDRLGLPGSWADGALAEHLGGWGVVEALGRGLLGSLHARYAGDPIWEVLAALAGRAPDQPLGAELPHSGVFRLPGRWLRRYAAPDATFVTAAAGARLCLAADNAGYLIADLPCDERAADELAQAEIAAYRAELPELRSRSGVIGPLEPLDEELAARLSPAAGWWLVRALGFVRYLLARALGQPALDSHQLATELLCRPGRIELSRTHLDLHMGIEQISVAVRCAGLDCNPGWTPDLGYIVLFHFDE